MIDFAMVDFGQEEIEAVNKVMQGAQLASGHENEAFEKEFAKYVGAQYAVLVNSGSSANLLALASLNLKGGSKVVTSACGFPATLSPILHLRLTPGLVDYNAHTLNIDTKVIVDNLEGVSAVIFAHTLGNPVEMSELIRECDKRGISVIEDCCEAVGSKVNGISVGSFGTLGTFSFYPAHQMTALGSGGMVVTNNKLLYQRMKSLRDWGKMYDWDSSNGGVQTDYTSPIGYHRGYTYETVGWNFKLPEANAAFGRIQLKRLDSFSRKRYSNWKYMHDRLKSITEIYVPVMSEESSPFGLPIVIPGHRNGLGMFLEKSGIKHRPFFAGNILRQPAFMDHGAERFPVADHLMANALFVGCHTKMSKEDMDFIVHKVSEYVVSHVHA